MSYMTSDPCLPIVLLLYKASVGPKALICGVIRQLVGICAVIKHFRQLNITLLRTRFLR